MRRINKIQHISNQRHLITRVVSNQIKDIKIGQTVVTKDLIDVGRIFDIFGPLNHPFISIKLNPDIKGEENLVGQLLYSFEKRTPKNRMKKK